MTCLSLIDTHKGTKPGTQMHPVHLSANYLITMLSVYHIVPTLILLTWIKPERSLQTDQRASKASIRQIVLVGFPRISYTFNQPMFSQLRGNICSPWHAQAKRDAVPKPKYLFSFSFSFSFLSWTDDPFQRGGERRTRREETGETARERRCREGKRKEGRKEDKLHMIHACKF